MTKIIILGLVLAAASGFVLALGLCKAAAKADDQMEEDYNRDHPKPEDNHDNAYVEWLRNFKN